jgi:AcrR family transcriptional regulator
METVLETSRPRRVDRRSAILEIAREAFVKDGYAATSMSHIAARVGGSKATLYSLFSSKKDLFVAVADLESTRILDAMFDVPEMGGEPKAALAGLCRRFLSVVLSDDMIASYRLIVSESARVPEVGRVTYELGLRHGLERLAVYFRRMMQSGALRTANSLIAAESFLDLTTGYLHKQRLWNVVARFNGEAIDAEVERIVATFLAAYGNDALSRAAREYTGI